MYDKRNDVNMSFDDFAAELRNSVEKLLDGKAIVTLSTIEKVNASPAKILTILYPGDNVSPAMNLELFYEEYRRGTNMGSIARQVIALYMEEGRSGNYDVSFFTDYEQARGHLVCHLVNYERNRDILEHIPYTRFFDLAVVYFYEMEGGASGKFFILVRDKHIESWGIDLCQLHETAVDNTRRKHPYQLKKLPQLYEETDGEQLLFSLDEAMCGEEMLPMYVLTNEDLCFGAVNICFPDLLRVIRRQVGGDFYILPSSIHECIILPDSSWGKAPAESMQGIVREINAKYVAAEEVLGDSVYHYSMEKQGLEIVA